MINLLDGGVESPHAAESSRERNLSHRQPGFVYQLFGKLQPARLRHGAGRRSQMTQEQPPKMARADAEALGKAFYSSVFKPALCD